MSHDKRLAYEKITAENGAGGTAAWQRFSSAHPKGEPDKMQRHAPVTPASLDYIEATQSLPQ
jgi:hypothetical protein